MVLLCFEHLHWRTSQGSPAKNGKEISCHLQPALLSQAIPESCQHELNICRGGIVSHDAHSPALAHSPAKAARNLHAVLGHCICIHSCPVHSLRHLQAFSLSRKPNGLPRTMCIFNCLQLASNCRNEDSMKYDTAQSSVASLTFLEPDIKSGRFG